MKRILLGSAVGGRLRVACLTLASLHAGSVLADEPFTIVSMTRDGNEVALEWSGGTGPFQVQAGESVEDLADVGTAVSGRAARVVWEGDEGYFRVLSNAVGARFGRFDVMQGEFDDPLGRHRLKSVWEFFEPRGGAPMNPPGAFYQSLYVRMESWEESGLHEFNGKLADLPGAEVTVDDRFLRVVWSVGEGEERRDFTLSMEFGYSLEGVRFQPLHLSDAFTILSCRYAHPQWTVDFEGTSGTTLMDETQLVEMVTKEDEEEGGFFPWEREVDVRSGSVSVRSVFDLGRFYFEGEPAFILKTPVLLDWRDGTVVSGLTEQPFRLAGHYSQTYDPSHHNFVETLWLEPEREPGIAPEVLEELREKNIWMIRAVQPTAFPEEPTRLQAVGFDGSLRNL